MQLHGSTDTLIELPMTCVDSLSCLLVVEGLPPERGVLHREMVPHILGVHAIIIK